jgi:hypothetical protein
MFHHVGHNLIKIVITTLCTKVLSYSASDKNNSEAAEVIFCAFASPYKPKLNKTKSRKMLKKPPPASQPPLCVLTPHTPASLIATCRVECCSPVPPRPPSSISTQTRTPLSHTPPPCRPSGPRTRRPR